jgi:antitoxin (DNA-binding transcriptional repressor) of toxin-antitoxin stability system
LKTVSITEFKRNCSALLERVRGTRKPLLITRHGKAIAEIRPPFRRIDMFGSMKDKSKITGDIISPAIDEDEWECLK